MSKANSKMEKSQELSIRMANEEDVVEIHSALSNSFKEYKHYFTKGAYALMVVTVDEVKIRMEEGPIWVAEINNKIVGSISATFKNAKFFIRGMVVLPHLRGLRIGYKLLQQVEDYARQKKYNILYLTTTAYIDAGIKLYKRFGFHIVNEAPYQIDGTHCINMQIEIDHEEQSPIQNILNRNNDQHYLIIELYKEGKSRDIYNRFSKYGRMLPEGVEYIDSWVDESLQKCYQIMKSESIRKLHEWTEKWSDLVEFEIIPVINSTEAAKKSKFDT